MRALIVNADDFGLSTGVNRGIMTAIEEGVVTSASLMVRRPAAADAAVYARTNRALSVGLHLDLGEWAYRDGKWEALCTVDGKVDDIIHEQLAGFRHLVGREPTHLDSHQHVHREEPIASAVHMIARDLGIPVRCFNAAIMYRGDFYGQTSKGERLHDAIGVSSLLTLLEDLPIGITELGCHPGLGVDDLSYGIERAMEVRALCDARVRAYIGESGIDLRSFADLVC